MKQLFLLVSVCAGLVWGGRVVTTQQAEVGKPRGSSATETRLIFPFATTLGDFDTEITISNTSEDTSGTVPQTGSCALAFYGSGAPPTGTSVAVAAGKQLVFQLSEGADGIRPAPGFQGYVVANCGFPHGRGAAKIRSAGQVGFSIDAQVVEAPGRNAARKRLLFPFISNQGGLDSRIVISNATADPFGMRSSANGCSLYFYGANAPASPVGVEIPAGAVEVIATSTKAPGFQGYVIGSCAFGGAIGVALVSGAQEDTAFSENAELLDSVPAPGDGKLLFPIVEEGSRIAIANTSLDPFGAPAASGSCSLSFYGKGAPSPTTTGDIAPGSVFTMPVSAASGFKGYVVAACGFTRARGWALAGPENGGQSHSGPAEILGGARDITPAPLVFGAVTNRDGADTEIVITNTSQDPLGTSQAAGRCVISYFGEMPDGGVPAPATSATIQPGGRMTFTLSEGNPAQGIAAARGFRGYAIADCGFPQPRGAATVKVNAPAVQVTASEPAEGSPDGSYFVTVSNSAGAGTTTGPVSVTETLPAEVELVGMAGEGWNCTADRCSRRDPLRGGASYPPIRVSVRAPAGSNPALTSRVSVSGGGSATASAMHALAIPSKRVADVVLAPVVSLRNPAPHAASVELRFIPVTPCRVVDTRLANGAFGGPQITGGTTRDFAIPSGNCGIPSTAQAYSLNVTVVPAGSLGYVTVWPSGATQPVASTLNALDGRIKSNAAIVPAGTNGAISVFASNTTHVVIDINGYFVPATDPSSLAFYPVTPCRVADTRNATGPLGGPFLAGGQSRPFPILSSACNIPASAQAYSLNLTAVPKGALGYITAWPTGQTQPLASTLNAPTGTVVANAAIVPAGSGGAVQVFASNDTNLVIDINGYFAAPGTGGLSLYNVTPCRALDTRSNGGTAWTGQHDVNIAATPCGVPATAQAVILSVTAVPPAALGYITLWPQGQTQPLASTLNALDGAITSNLAIVPMTNGVISVFPSNSTHLILDVFGYLGQPTQAGGGTITVSNVNLGENLQAQIGITLNPAPTASVTLTINSDNGNVLLGSGDVNGTTSLTATISAGTASVSTFAKALASSGTANITVSAPGYTTGTGTATLFHSGFAISSPNGIGAAFTTYQGVNTDLTVYAARLDNAGIFAETQQVRGGASFSVTIGNLPTTTGSVTTPLAFTGATSSAITTFAASSTNTGSSTITATAPAPFIAPTGGASVAVTVQGSGFLPCDAGTPIPTIGKNLQTNTCARLTSAPLSGPVTVTLQSNNPSKLMFSATPTGTPTATLTVTVPKNQTTTTDFYLHAFDSAGPVTYTETAAGYGSATMTVNLTGSALLIQSPTGLGGDFTVSLGTIDPTLSIYTAAVDGTGAVIATQAVAGGVSIPVAVTSSATSVGTIVTSPISISGGSSFASTNFHGVSVGTTTVTASSTGYTSGIVHATVQNPAIVVAGGLTIGKFLQEAAQVILPVAAPAGGLTVTLQSNDGLLRFSADPTTAGTSTLTINFTQGQTIANYYIQAAGSAGTATYTGSAPGYTTATGSIALAPSAVVIGALGTCQTATCTVSASGSPQPMTIYTVPVDSNGAPIRQAQALAGGPALTVTLNNSNPAAGTLPPTLTIAPNTNSATGNFTPGTPGVTTVSVTQPTGWTTPTSNTSVTITVQ